MNRVCVHLLGTVEGVTAEYPATSSALGKMAGYAVRRENKFKMAMYVK